MKLLVIQNCKTERIGLYEQYLIDNEIDYDIFHAYSNDIFLPISKYSLFIVGGTPISAYEISRHNFLRKEWRYLKQVVLLNKPYFGICFGCQLLSRILGAKVRRNPVKEIGGYDVFLFQSRKREGEYHKI